MRLNSPGTALVMKRAALGPAAMALRAARMKNGGAYLTSPAGSMLVTGGSTGYLINPQRQAFGALGAAPVVAAAGTAVASKGAAVAGTSIAAYAGAGSFAGPIGLAVGAIVGVIATKLFNKNYLNVPQANANQAAEVEVFNHYRPISGQIAGRQLGLEAMEHIWKGAVWSGLFPKNNHRLCFHEGCFKYAGDPGWVSGAIHGGRGTGAYSFPYAFGQMQKDGVFSQGTQVSTVAPVMRQPLPVLRGGGRVAGLGRLGAVSGTPEAVILIDQYFIPNNRSDSPAWAIPSNPLEHQLLYDVADAWLATQAVPTTPNVGAAPAGPAAGGPAAGVPSAGGPVPAPGLPPSGPALPGSPVDVGWSTGMPTGTGGGGMPSLVGAGSPVTTPTTAGPVTAGLANLPAWSWVLVGLSVMFALARPAHPVRTRRQRR